MQNKIDISKMSDIELKALGFDLKNEREMIEQNLQVLYTEINRRLSVNKKTMENTEEVKVEAPVEEVVAESTPETPAEESAPEGEVSA